MSICDYWVNKNGKPQSYILYTSQVVFHILLLNKSEFLFIKVYLLNHNIPPMYNNVILIIFHPNQVKSREKKIDNSTYILHRLNLY